MNRNKTPDNNELSAWGAVMFPKPHVLENSETRHCSYYNLKIWK